MKKRSFFVILLLLLFSSLCACGKSNKVMISEVYLDSKSEAGWIEIYNYGEDEVDLSGYGLSDSKKEIFRYKFAEGTILPAGECLVVYCEKSAEQKHFYKAGIKLSSKGEDLYLVTAKGKSVHVLSCEKVKDGCSYGCIIDENGEAIWAYCDEVSPGIVNSKKYFAVESPILSYYCGGCC